VDNVTDNLESTAVTKYSGTGDISGMVLNTNILTIGSNQNNSVSVTNLGLCDVDTGCLDEDIMHTSNSGALLVQASGNTYTDETLKVLASNTLTVDSGATETVTTEKINNAGIITSIGSPTYTLAGTDGTPFVNSGTFTPSTSTVSYTGNNSGGNTTIENVTYYNMEVNNSAETYVLDSTLVGNTAGTLTITNGTLDTTGSNYGIQFGKINIANTSTAILTANSSTVTLSDTSGTLFTKGSTGVFNAGTSTVLISKQGTGTHTYNSKFGSAGTGNGQFGNYDFGIAVDPSGNIYLGDNSNSRVQKFDSSGTYVSQFGTLGTGNGQFNGSVTGVAIDSSGNIYVADGVLDRVQKFNSSGTYVSQFGSTGTGDGQFDTPFGIAIDPSDNIYVVDGVNSRVQKFDSSGTYVSKFGTLGTGNGQFTNPRGIAIDSSGNIFVVDAWNHRIEKFDSSGNYISQFNDTAGFSYPTGIHIDAYDNIYIADQGHSVISKFNSSGTFIADIATNGATDGLVNQAYNLSSNSSGDIYILDTYNKRIQKFTTANDTQTVSVASGSPSFYNLTFTSPGTKTIGETLTATGALTITAGTVDTVSGQNRTVNAGSIIINGGTFTPQASTVNVTGTGAVFNYTAGTFTAGASTIKLTDTSSTLKTFAGGGQTFNNFWYAPGSGTGTLEVRGANTFSDFKDDGSAAHSILFTAGTTQTITTFTVSGNPGALITINSGNGAGATSTATHTLSKASGIVNSDYLNIQHSVATGGATWNGGVNSTDNQSTSSAGSGWVFSITCTSQVTTGNWNTAGTWSCGSVPTAGATTTIRAGDVITMDIASNVLGAITINGTLTTSGTNYALSGTTLDISSTGTLTANGSTITLSGTSGTLFTKHATGTFTPGTSTVVLSGNGSATVNSGAITFNSLTSSGTGTKTSGEAIVVGGDLIISAGTFNPSMYDLTVTGTTSITGTLQDTSPTATNLFIGAVTVNNGGTWSGGVGNAPYEFRGGLTVNSTSTFTSGYSVYTFSTNPQTIDGTQSITISSLLNTITTGDGLTFSGSNTTVTALAQGTDAVLTFSGTVPTITTLVATANPNTVQYTGSAQTVKGTTYHHLIVNGSGTATLGASTTVNGNATVTAGTLDPTSSYTLTGSGTNILSVGASGTVKAQHSTFAGTYISFETVTLSTGSTVDYALTGTQTIDNTLSYSNLNTSGSGTKTLGGDTTVSGVLTITAGTLDASTFNTTLSGTTGTPFVVTGTFTPNLGTVTYTGNNSGGNTTVAGTNYYHLTINNSAETYVLGGAITGNSAGTLTITDGTLDTTSANNYDIIFGKINIANTATAGLTANGSTITLNETTGTLFTKGRYGVFNAGTSNVYLASGASSWTQQTGSGTRNWRSVASSADGSKLAAVVYNGYIYTSVDNGATWSTNSNSSGSHFWNSITSSTDGIKLAATDGNNGYIYTSSDGGVTWTTNSNSSGQHSWTGIASSSDGTKLVATADSDYIYTSTDSGVTWGTQSNASGTAGWTSVASSADGTKLAATVYSGYIYTSTDSGASWGTQSSASGSRLWYDVAISSDGTKLAAVNNAGYIYTSANSGSSWTQQTNSGVHDWETIAMSDNGNKLIAGASGDYVMTSVDSGVNWTEQTSAGARNWKSVASSADGVKFIGGAYTGYVYTYAPSSSTQNVTVASGSPEFNNLTSYSAGTKSLDAALIVTGALTISAGTFDTTAANNYTVWAGTITINGGTFTPQASIVSLTGASGILFTKSSGTFTAGTSNVDMIGNGSATVASGNPSFYNLTSSGTGTKSLGENLTVTNGLTISAGTFDPTTSFTATGSGTNTLTVSSGATIKVQHSTFAGTYPSFETRTMDSGSTVDYALAGTQTVDEAITYANLNTSGAGTKTLGGDTTASNLTIGASSTLDGSSYTLTLSGIGNVFTNSGTYTANTSTIKFTDSSSNAKTLALGGGTYNNIWLAPSTGTGSYTITGSNTFNDFKDDGTGAHDINFTEGTTTTISSLTLDTNASSRISLKSSIPSLYWYLVDSSGTNTVSYISIEDSCASGGASWIASDGTSIDVNHNCGWVFFVGSRGGGSGGSVESSATPQGGVTGGGVDGGSGGAGGEGSGDVGTCADSIQNGDETGVDSGGRCAGNGGQGGGGGGDLGFSYTRSMLASAGSINFRQSFRNLFGNLFRFF
ncbi:MAG: hypothetical protein QG566_280, partial [Patescibacteria group bacterium]|nr:hypothetical protein [Patescibacteria group bacterium]